MLVDHSIGPVWEANHVWLIYILVIWWTGFPAAFAAAMTTLFIPMMLALAGIVLRGASFAFRKYAATFTPGQVVRCDLRRVVADHAVLPRHGGRRDRLRPRTGGGYGDQFGSWINPTSLVGGCLAVATCVFLAGVFLTADAARGGDPDLAERLRTRTLAVGIVTGLIVFAGLYPVVQRRADAQPRVAQSRPAATGGGRARRRRHPRAALSSKLFLSQGFSRPTAVGAVVTGWGVGQYPWMLVDQFTINDAAGAHSHAHRTPSGRRARRGHCATAAGYLIWLTQTEKWSRT